MAAMHLRASRTEVLPEPFGPRSKVNGSNGSVVLRNALKLVNSMDSIIAFSESVSAVTV